MDQIKNIIFDLGGVILDLEYIRTTSAFIDLGIKDFDKIYSQKLQQHFFDDFEKGNITATQFRKEVKKHLDSIVSDDSIDAAWNAMLLTIPPSRIELLKQIQNKYRIFLLSNTNEIHIKAFQEILKRDFGKDILIEVFEKCYYSSMVRLRKPEPEIFNYVIEQNNLKLSDTLFIDDSIQHVMGALEVGLNATLLEPGTNIEQLINQLGLD